MYAHGNYVDGFPRITEDNWNGGIDFSPEGDATENTLRVKEPFVTAPIVTQPAEDAYRLVLNHAGASLSRDAVDRRIVEEIRTKTARYGASWGGGGKGIIDSQADVGGWPPLNSTAPPTDSDEDGMPDDWETSARLDPANPDDNSGDQDGDGYTNIEDYLNSLVPAID
jgi:hypothetical protein